MPSSSSFSSFFGSAPWFSPWSCGGFPGLGGTLVFAPLRSAPRSLRCWHFTGLLRRLLARPAPPALLSAVLLLLGGQGLAGLRARLAHLPSSAEQARSQAGPQRPTPSLPAARRAHRRPAAELAVSPSRGRRRRGAPAPRPHAAPSCKPPRGCSARLRLYSQAGAARAAGRGGPRSAGGGRRGPRHGEGARTPAPAPRAPCGGRGPGRSARWGRGRAAAASASRAPGGSRCTSRGRRSRPSPSPSPIPGLCRGGGERGRLGRGGRARGRAAPQPGEVL